MSSMRVLATALVVAITFAMSSGLSIGGKRTRTPASNKGISCAPYSPFWRRPGVAASSGVAAVSPRPPIRNSHDRRSILASAFLLAGGGTGILGSVDPAGAEVDASPLPSDSKDGSPPTDTSIFVGTYTDPVNHPGGTRTIAFTGTGFGGYELATVRGGGGRGEPESYELPAMAFKCPGNNRQRGGKWCITVDFSPKGGPRDFQGYYDEKEGGIRFVLDDNFWPKQ